jgi:membrane protein YqaA with SNARE-associated domain
MIIDSAKLRKYIAISLLAAIVIITVGGSVLLVQHWEYMKMLEKQGLLGLFLISIFAGSPIPIPSPNMILTFTMGSIFNPALVGLVSGFGNAMGNALVYLTGRGGLLFFRNLGLTRSSNENHPSWIDRILKKFRMPRVREFGRKHALLAVFILGMYPNPVLMAIIIGMGAARYNFWKFFVVCWAGKTVESFVLSYLGYFGLRSILHYFGVEVP